MKQFIKFVGVGAINTFITYLLYLLLLIPLSYSIAYTITYICGIGFSYWLNLKYVFKEESSKKKIILFPLVYLVQYLLGILILYVSIEKFSIPKELAPLIVIILTVPLVFVLTKKVLTKKNVKEIAERE